MQEIAERLTVLGRLPASHRVRRTSPLPVWLTDTLDLAESKGKPWYHVYLDNFCAMEKVGNDPDRASGAEMHLALEKAWERTGVLSSAKKRVSEAGVVQELGAQVDGVKGTLGPSPERVLKLVQSTLVGTGQGQAEEEVGPGDRWQVGSLHGFQAISHGGLGLYMDVHLWAGLW